MHSTNAVNPVRAPRRFVDQRGNTTRVTRKSAPARITTLPDSTLQVPYAAATAAAAAGVAGTPAKRAGGRKEFTFSPAATPRGRGGRKQGLKGGRGEPLDFSQEVELDDGEESDSSYNSFTLELKKKELLGKDSLLGLGEQQATGGLGGGRSPSPARSLKSSHGSHPTTYRVLRSRYDGDLFRTGNLTARLVVAPERRPGQAESMKPLFHWIHVENPTMNFGAYMDCVLRCPYLEDEERVSINTILKSAREKSDRSLRMPPGMKGNYVEPEFFEETIQTTVYEGPRSKRLKTQIVRWLSVPYFFLGTTNTSSSSEEGGDDTDIKPHFFATGFTAQGEFFQVAQLWCLMLGDSLIVSCARRAISDLPGKLIDIITLPPADPAHPLTGERAPVIQVSDGGIKVWLLPLENCETWAEFAANFVTLGFNLADGWEIKYKDIALDVDDWPRVVSVAKKTSIRLVLSKKARDDDADADYESSDNESEGDVGSIPEGLSQYSKTDEETQTESPFTQLHVPELSPAGTTSTEQPVPGSASGDRQSSAVSFTAEGFHVFTVLATDFDAGSVPQVATQNSTAGPGTRTTAQQFQANEQVLRNDLAEMNKYLSTKNSRPMESESYTQCPTKTTRDVEASIEQLKALRDQDSRYQQEYNRKIAFARAARDVFEFFFPLRYENVVTLKYWGALDRIIRAQGIKSARGQFDVVVRDMSSLARVTNEIKLELFSGRDARDYVTTVPHEFIQAWMLCLMYFIMFTTEYSPHSVSHIRRCRERLLQGRVKMIERLQTVNIHDMEAVLPLGITSLLLGQLLQDNQGPLIPDRHRLTSFYWEYLQSFTQHVRDRPLSRKYQNTFSILKEQLETVIAQLEDQQRVLVALDDSINEGETASISASSPSPASTPPPPQGRESSVVEFLLLQTEEMLQNFAEMSRRTTDLESWHLRMIDANKDRQEKAAMTFTTVTVFFLPLTTLASIMGMNTYDIRNMNDTQWVFWSVAAPMCLTGGVLWLALANCDGI